MDILLAICTFSSLTPALKTPIGFVGLLFHSIQSLQAEKKLQFGAGAKIVPRFNTNFCYYITVRVKK